MLSFSVLFLLKIYSPISTKADRVQMKTVFSFKLKFEGSLHINGEFQVLTIFRFENWKPKIEKTSGKQIITIYPQMCLMHNYCQQCSIQRALPKYVREVHHSGKLSEESGAFGRRWRGQNWICDRLSSSETRAVIPLKQIVIKDRRAKYQATRLLT